MENKWNKALKKLRYAFQPIVELSTGKTFALEALLRNTGNTEFRSIDNFFDSAASEDILFTIDISLRELALKKIMELKWSHETKLFYNYDPRMSKMSNYMAGMTERLLKKYPFPIENICFELSEKYRFNSDDLKNLLINCQSRGIKIALDDFGSGFSGIELLLKSEPDFIKFDRFIISDLEKSQQKRTVCRNLIKMANELGSVTIAEGVENRSELQNCMDLGFNMVQGYYIARPTLNIDEIERVNSTVVDFISHRCDSAPRKLFFLNSKNA